MHFRCKTGSILSPPALSPRPSGRAEAEVSGCQGDWPDLLRINQIRGVKLSTLEGCQIRETWGLRGIPPDLALAVALNMDPDTSHYRGNHHRGNHYRRKIHRRKKY